MNRLWSWLYPVPGRDRLVLLAGLTIRAAGIVMLGYVLPLSWTRLAHPGLSLLLAALLVGESLVVIGWWLARHRLDPRTLWLDLPTGVLALLAGAALLGRAGVVGWTLFAYPYMVLISFAVGLTCRRLPSALAAGALWGLANVVGLALFRPGSWLNLALIVPSYLVNPAVGWGLARLLRRGADELDAARIAAVRETADLVTAAQRARLTTALHDRILQTLETLARADALPDPELRQRVQARAAWLRRYVETGRADQSDDLVIALEAAARAAQQAGITVEVNDARLRTGGAELPAAQRDALVEAAFQTINAFRASGQEIVVRATPEGDGILLTVLATGPGRPDPADLTDARSRLASAGGRLTVEAAPYAELWVPHQ